VEGGAWKGIGGTTRSWWEVMYDVKESNEIYRPVNVYNDGWPDSLCWPEALKSVLCPVHHSVTSRLTHYHASD
jgi:hypothetical protein